MFSDKMLSEMYAKELDKASDGGSAGLFGHTLSEQAK